MTSPVNNEKRQTRIKTDENTNVNNKDSSSLLSPFESNKGRNRPERQLRGSKNKTKHHTRWKSGFTKSTKRNYLNKSAMDWLKQKAPSANERRNATSHSLNNKRQSMNFGTTGAATPSNKIDKLVRDNIIKNKEKELVREIEKLQLKEGHLMK